MSKFAFGLSCLVAYSCFKRAYDNNYRPVMEVLEDAVKSDIATRHVKNMDYDELLIIKLLMQLV
jgi:hypothetical protein